MKNLSVRSGAMEVSIVDMFGAQLPLYFHENSRVYVKAVHGLQYKIRATISETGRFEVLAGIDGRDTLKNAPADLIMSGGMVIRGYFPYEVPGWGKNATTPFIFTEYDRDTMAVRKTGSTDNLGVIAVAYFREYVPPPRPRANSEYLSMGIGDGPHSKGGLESFSAGATRSAGMGTGTNENDVTRRQLGTTTFNRANYTTPDGLVEIYAMPEWWLLENRVIVDRPYDRNHPAGFRQNRGDY